MGETGEEIDQEKRQAWSDIHRLDSTQLQAQCGTWITFKPFPGARLSIPGQDTLHFLVCCWHMFLGRRNGVHSNGVGYRAESLMGRGYSRWTKFCNTLPPRAEKSNHHTVESMPSSKMAIPTPLEAQIGLKRPRKVNGHGVADFLSIPCGLLRDLPRMYATRAGPCQAGACRPRLLSTTSRQSSLERSTAHRESSS